MKRQKQVLMAGALLAGLLFLQGCMFGMQLRTEQADPRALSGSYDLLLYGCRYPDDLEHAAFLIPPDDRHSVELFVPDTSYRVKKGIPAAQAIAEADAFIRCGIHTVQETRFHKVLDDSGAVVGYEVLPRYLPYDIGGPDPLLVTYSLKAGKVTVYIGLRPEVERHIKFDAPGIGSD